MRGWLRFVIFALCLPLVPAATPELGQLGGAKFRIDRPDRWNGVLILYCHGYSGEPGAFTSGSLHHFDPFFEAGYAIAQSGYSQGGWAVEQAVAETEAIRRYFIAKYGKPKETYVMGHSMGGFLTMELLETQPASYDGGLAFCGPLAPASLFFQKILFDLLVLTSYQFPGILPKLDQIPSGFQANSIAKPLSLAMQANPQKLRQLKAWGQFKTDTDVHETVVFFLGILQELEGRAQGLPFDNRSTVYTGFDDDNALNDGVARYALNPAAHAYLVKNYSPTGHLRRPLLAVHTTYDPVVPAWIPSEYARLLADLGHSNLFVQRYVKRDGHCMITSSEMIHAFEDLRTWKRSGQPPAAGSQK